MTQYYRWKFYVVRRGSSYNLRKKDYRLSLQIFIPQGSPFCATIGGSENDFIQVKGLAEKHISCVLMPENLVFQTKDSVHLTLRKLRKQLGAKKNLCLPLKVGAKGYNFKLTFPDETIVIAKIRNEEESISEETEKILTKKYGPIQKIQEGKSSVVYKTENQKALKILRPSYSKSIPVIKRFLNAAEKFREIDDPFFIKITDIVYQKNKNLYYVESEYYDGETLENYVGRKGVLPPEEATSIAREIAERLAAFQRCGYSCRNLAPGNMLLCRDERVRITGFFLLKSEAKMTMQNAKMVIPKYTAPEQIQDASSADIISDVFSLGAILHTLLTGTPPLQAKNTQEYIDRIMDSTSIEAQEIFNIAPFLSQNICQIAASLLEFDPKRRPDPRTVITMLSSPEEVPSSFHKSVRSELVTEEDSMIIESLPVLKSIELNNTVAGDEEFAMSMSGDGVSMDDDDDDKRPDPLALKFVDEVEEKDVVAAGELEFLSSQDEPIPNLEIEDEPQNFHPGAKKSDNRPKKARNKERKKSPETSRKNEQPNKKPRKRDQARSEPVRSRRKELEEEEPPRSGVVTFLLIVIFGLIAVISYFLITNSR